MRREDIYQKPKRPLSEYFSLTAVTIVIAAFVVFEIIHYATTSTPKSLEKKAVKNLFELNKTNLVHKDAQEEANTTLTTQAAQTPATVEAPAKKELTFDEIVTSYSDEALYEYAVNTGDLTQEQKNIILERLITADKRISEEQKSLEVKRVSLLIAQGFKLNLPYEKANKLIQNRHYEMARILVENGVLDPNTQNIYGYTLLHEASSRGHVRLITFLVSMGADINATAKDGASVLHYPTHLGFSKTVNALIAMGIDTSKPATLKYPGVEWKASTPLHIAVEKDRADIVKMLLDAGSDRNATTSDGLTPLMIAKEHNYTDILPLFE